jgi:hypothetical protein
MSYQPTPRVLEAVRLMQRVYEHNPVGGNLHVIIDDGNMEDYFLDVDFNENVFNSDPVALYAEMECLDYLKTLTYRERLRAYRLL